MTRSEELVLDFMTYRLSEIYPENWLRPTVEDLGELCFLSELGHKDVDRWLKVPLHYLGASESFLVGVAKYFASSGGEGPELEAYFLHAKNEAALEQEELRAVASFALGILAWEGRDYARAKREFESALLGHEHSTYVRLALIVSLVALGEWNETPRHLLRLSKIHYRPAAIYKVLAALYEKLGLDGPQRFYQFKSKKAEVSFGLSFI